MESPGCCWRQPRLERGWRPPPRPLAMQALPPQGVWGSQQTHPTATPVFLSRPGLHACVLRCFSRDPMDCGPPGSSVRGILQARVLEWVAIPFSRASSPPRDRTRVSYVSCIGRWVLTTSATWEALVHSDQRQKWRCFAMGNEVNSDTSFPRCRVHQGDEGIYSGFLRSYEVLVRDYWERNLAYFSAHIGQNSFGLRAKKQDNFYVLSYYLILLFCQIIDLEQRGGERDFSWQNI